MIIGATTSDARASPPRFQTREDLWLCVIGALGGALVALLVVHNLALVAMALIVALPATALILRYPFGGVLIWLVFAQFVVETEGGGLRKAFWLVHRALPMIAIASILLGALTGLRRVSLPRLGLTEMLMGGYLLLTTVSILYTSDNSAMAFSHVLDRIAAPMCLYLLVRLAGPAERDFVRVAAAMGAVVVCQSAIGLIGWTNPALLPNAWHDRLGDRTTGSLGHANVFGVTMIVGGLLVFHAISTGTLTRRLRACAIVACLLSLVMVFMTFGRANWLAGGLCVAGLFFIHPRHMTRATVLLVPLLFVVVGQGAFSNYLQFADSRLVSSESEESALSRLPVVYASLRMLEAKPLFGFGYGNFDRFDREYQSNIGELVVAEKDHASHNLYLTILAEQGLVGFLLYLGPAACLLARTSSRSARIRPTGLVSPSFVKVLWLGLVAHLVVTNFANMRGTYGLGLWWLTLGMVAAVIDKTDLDRARS
ncbi:MAG TPA: O-antigen ligase family protein [Acidimicrobiales bacterium]|nr:O-antigen ligase family protein [Acidimicrobiales bacterium]